MPSSDVTVRVIEALDRTHDDLSQRALFAHDEDAIFAESLLTRLEAEVRNDDPFPLDLWVSQLASLDPIADYVRVIDLLWADILRHTGPVPVEAVASLLRRRDRLMESVAAAETKGEHCSSRITAAEALYVLLQTYAPIHVQNARHVADICAALANHLQGAPRDPEVFWAAGLVHDVGMVMVPRDILERRGRLSLDECEVVKRHVEFGIGILRSVGPLRDCVPIIGGHHERFDGAGYPKRLKGDEIPLGARILAVADSVESMLSSRPHRAARTPEEVRTILLGDNGAQWDPDVAHLAAELIAAGRIGTATDGCAS